MWSVTCLVHAHIYMILMLSTRELVIKKLFSAVWYVENKHIVAVFERLTIFERATTLLKLSNAD